MALSRITSEIKRLVENRDFFIPLNLTPPLRGSRWNTVIIFGMKQLEWCGYPTVKKFDDILYIQPFQHNTSV